MTDTPQNTESQNTAPQDTVPQETSTRLAGKVAIVTGGCQGVGRGISLGLAESGAAVVSVGRTMAKLEGAAEEIRSAGGTAECVAADIIADGAPETIISTAVERLGGVDILVNNGTA